jgi:hypothetical protein
MFLIGLPSYSHTLMSPELKSTYDAVEFSLILIKDSILRVCAITEGIDVNSLFLHFFV